MKKAVIFDFDGVIVDTFPYALKAFAAIFNEMHLDFNEQFLRERFGSGPDAVARDFLKHNGINPTEAGIKELITKKNEYQLRIMDQRSLLPGVRELLVALQKNGNEIKTALATINNPHLTMELLYRLDIKGYFSVVLTQDDISQRKPSPEIFLKAAEKLKVNPSQCIVIEDSAVGIKAARNAGMFCIAVATGTLSQEELAEFKPDAIMGSLQETKKILELIKG